MQVELTISLKNHPGLHKMLVDLTLLNHPVLHKIQVVDLENERSHQV